jgi:thioredoxin 1
MTTHIEEVNDDNFAKIVLGSTRLALVDFWAQWCGPCRALAPVVESVAKQYAESVQVVKLNVDGNPSVVEKFHIEAIPTLIVFQNGEEKDRMIGAVSQTEIAQKLDIRLVAAVN